MAWDDGQYLAFADERTRPARELLARVPLETARLVVDLGCGPGNSTALLRQRYSSPLVGANAAVSHDGTTRIIGVDNSEEMLRRARADHPEGEWIYADLATYDPPGAADLIVANAVLQWVPHHAAVLARLLSHVRPGGVLAVQMPLNFDAPSHRLMRQLNAYWEARLADVVSLFPVHSPAAYYDLLAPHTDSLDIWQTTYQHVMADGAAVVSWVKGTGMRPYLAALSPPEQEAYLEEYLRAVERAYPLRADGRRLFAFERLFIVATARTSGGEPRLRAAQTLDTAVPRATNGEVQE